MLLKLTCLVPLFPLIGSIINGFFGLKIGKNAVGLIACGSMALSFLTSILIYIGYLMLPEGQHIFEQVVWTWLGAGDFSVDFGFQIDPPHSGHDVCRYRCWFYHSCLCNWLHA